MKQKVVATEIPVLSNIHAHLIDANFFDSFQIHCEHHNKTAIEIYLSLIAKTPRWFNFLMSIRNHIVGLFGIKNLGALGTIESLKLPHEYQVGDRVGIFSIYSISNTEVILIDSDKHLDAKVSFLVTESLVIASTVVHIHNLLGRIYIFFVAPAHKLIVPSMLAKLND
jgi:hypothetical protein